MMCVGASPNSMVDRWPDTYVRLALHRHQFAAHAARSGAAAVLRLRTTATTTSDQASCGQLMQAGHSQDTTVSSRRRKTVEYSNRVEQRPRKTSPRQQCRRSTAIVTLLGLARRSIRQLKTASYGIDLAVETRTGVAEWAPSAAKGAPTAIRFRAAMPLRAF